MIDRGEILSRFQFQLPGMNAASWAIAIHALMIVLAIAGLLWLALNLGRQHAKSQPKSKPAPVNEPPG
jgi:protein-S-isoprenylcysteine O-methyltransferase Ste14